MNRKYSLLSLPLLLCVGSLFAFSLLSKPATERSREEYPLLERGMKAVAVGEEIVSVARGQLGMLPDEGREEVEKTLDELDCRIAAVNMFLKGGSDDGGALSEAVEALEQSLEGILVVPGDDAVQQAGRTNT